jgi:DNA-directed RNA polymerase subunit beta
MSERIYFGSIKEAIEPPNLIEVQANSYVDFLQKDVPYSKRKNQGLQAVFKEVFPIESYDEKAVLDFSHYDIGEPKLTPLEAQREGQTYSAPLHVTFQLREEKGTKEEKVYMGEIPLMTPQGTFVINGLPELRSSPPSTLTARCCIASGSFQTAAHGSRCSSIQLTCFTFI